MSLRLRTTSHGHTLVLALEADGNGAPSAAAPLATASLTAAVCAAGIEVLHAAEATAHAVVFTGLHHVGAAAGDPGVPAALQAWGDELRTFARPVVALLERRIAAPGCVLALACDLRVATTAAALDLGLTPPDAEMATVLGSALACHLPPARALEVLLLGQALGAAELHARGLVSAPPLAPEVGDADAALAHALRLAGAVQAWPDVALARLKETLGAR